MSKNYSEEEKQRNISIGGYDTFYIKEPKLRKIEKSKYIDRIVHRWVVDNFLEPYFVHFFYVNLIAYCI